MLFAILAAAALCAGPTEAKMVGSAEMLTTLPEGPATLAPESEDKPDSTLFSSGSGDAKDPGFRSAPRQVGKDAAYKPAVRLGKPEEGEEPTAEDARKTVDRMLSGAGG